MQATPDFVSCLKEFPKNKKVYFASDFHLGAPNQEESLKREGKIIRWLEYISNNASAIFLVGDIFDFWFEYKTVVPKSFVRLLAKLSQLVEKKIDIYLFTGNHDMWMYNYFQEELGIHVFHHPISIEVGNKKVFIGHGDGLGSGDTVFKMVKKILRSPFFQWVFRWIHPDIGVRFAKLCSRRSKIARGDFNEYFEGEKEKLWQYSKQVNATNHHDFYIFGHRHLPLELPVSEKATYFNLGEWVSQCHYLEFDGENASLKVFEV